MDYTKLNGPDLLHEMGTDAAKWAEAFCQHYPSALSQIEGQEGVVAGDEFEGVMITWFANAIMHTLDTERGTIINGEHAEYLRERAKRAKP